MWNTVPWLADKFNLKITKMTQKCIPLTHNSDIYSSTLDMTIKAGNATGMSAIVTAETEEGIIIAPECIGKVYAEGEVDKNDWTIYGEPETRVVISEPKTVELTCASIVNRLKDVVESEAGYVPTSKMDQIKY